ncbi:MAG: asparagine synthase-related protein [Alphaproteobacteria bacterium]|nr:asparagine synthase-related protein [Alphaproteobacteria bacterium]
MGRIAGIVGPDGEAANSYARAMLETIGDPKASVARGLATSKSDQLVQLGRLRLVLDGTIYNPEDLPEPDRRLGSSSDAARLLTAVEQFGLVEALAKINGDFALALLDDELGSLSLARDRFGIRPLYHATTGSGIAFASRPRALLCIPGVSRSPDSRFLMASAATHHRFIDQDPTRSPFLDIAQVPAGFVVTLTNATVSRRRFADIKAGQTPDGTPNDQAEAYLHLLEDSVKRRLRHASKPIFTLSGGLDSSTIVALANRITGERPVAISSVHRDETYDERKEIMDVVNAKLVDWHPVEIDDPDLFALISKMRGFHDQPIPTVTWMSHYLLGERIAEMGFGSVFGGLGGDEQHAGEYDYFFYFFADLKSSGRTDLLEEEIAAWMQNHDHPVFRKSSEVADRMMAVLTDPGHPGVCRGNSNLLYRYKGLLDSELGSLQTLEPNLEASSASYLTSHMRNELLFNTMPCCLRAADRNAAALGFEEYHPFLDWRLFEFMLALPGERKIRNGVTKSFAREAYKGLLPEATRTRIKKTGWNAPAHQWFAGAGREPLLDLLSSRRFVERGIYNGPALMKLIDDHQDIIDQPRGREDHMMVLWQIVTLELWLRSVEDIPR